MFASSTAQGAALIGSLGALGFLAYRTHKKGCCKKVASPDYVLSPNKPAVVTITGAAGQIGYAITFMIASGRMLGPNQPLELRLLDLPFALKHLEGIHSEIDDCSFPLVHKVVITSDYQAAFENCDVALLIGAKPRSNGMERKDLLQQNASIFASQGKALNQYASRNVKVLVVGNPANTNAYIAMKNAPNLPPTAFTAMTRLDQNRAKAQIGHRGHLPSNDVKNVIIWGNHSSTQYPDVNHGHIKGSKLPLREALDDEKWLNNDFIKIVQQRGAHIMQLMNKSSAASAANAAVEHVRDWILGTPEGEWVSMAVPSDGSYGVPKDLVFSFPVTCSQGQYSIVQGLKIDEFSQQKLDLTTKELVEEKEQAGY